ncbi:hypothetical protein N0M98_19900 [Paenibacillus doosanensis]|uniref:PilZ domain-containing protein n=1 Tax=Paenibacillus konkukensis TaxID=2020716 RepID=A0ABY4RN35_9BACL|nr:MULTISPECIES: hypothetical protein [Paenibacillus]MCS7462388.1 hypothetical protein [Paenibacillus doosanensis]UQZ83231.1 hypothetical protein SK3146_02392 [Paenibacillus konkukensis]
MKDIQLLHKGKVYQGQVGYDQHGLMEVTLREDHALINGEMVLCFDKSSRQSMRILNHSQSKVLLAPVDSELFQIKARPECKVEAWLNEDKPAVSPFRLNTFATISEDFKTTAVRITDVSRYGLGFEVDDFSIRMHYVYDSMLICDDECIHPKLIVRYAHIMERTIRYGAEIHGISPEDLNKFRYYIAMEQFKHLMLV